MSNKDVVEQLRWNKFPVLDTGFVSLVDVMGDDDAIVQAARISYNKDSRDDLDRKLEAARTIFPDQDTYTEAQLEEAETRMLADSKHLIRYLMRHRHSTPFEMAEVKLIVGVPMDTWRQWIRHRTANVNEYSTRYTTAIDRIAKTAPDAWRLQADANKQGSGGMLERWPEGTGGFTLVPTPNGIPMVVRNVGKDSPPIRYPLPGDASEEATRLPGSALSLQEDAFHALVNELYQTRLALNVAREQARKDLSLSTYTEAYWKIDLHNMLHVLGLRMDSHAQLEIRQYATTIGEQIIKPLFPITWQAFVDYRLESMTLSRLDMLAIKMIKQQKAIAELRPENVAQIMQSIFPGGKREQKECVNKLLKLEILENEHVVAAKPG